MVQIMKNEDWKNEWYSIIFRHDTKKGRLFDEILLIIILMSVTVVFLDSMKTIHDRFKWILLSLEWFFTFLFTFEYIIRIIISPRKKKYIFSFYGVIDLLSIIPTYLSLIFAGTQFLIIIRILRLFRVFRILKLVRFTSASIYLIHALQHSREKIVVFFGSVLITVTILGTIMYIVEGPESGFVSIPTSIYWAIVTITTVGFGDITPVTPLGQIIASILMLTGYAIIAVPTGIITSEMSRDKPRKPLTSKECRQCKTITYLHDANYCANCGEKFEQPAP
jgi:voltage-gated potassium channel